LNATANSTSIASSMLAVRIGSIGRNTSVVDTALDIISSGGVYVTVFWEGGASAHASLEIGIRFRSSSASTLEDVAVFVAIRSTDSSSRESGVRAMGIGISDGGKTSVVGSARQRRGTRIRSAEVSVNSSGVNALEAY